MKPLKTELQDAETLRDLGSASVQIVHDLKNQLNGLKLYATFLRKRMEKSERPTDEQETLAKLIAGLERAASDMTVLVRYGRPVELRLQPHTDLVKILSSIDNAEYIRLATDAHKLSGAFDVAALTEALKTITSCATGLRSANDHDPALIHLRADANNHQAIIEWRGVKHANGDDPFHSFAGSEGLRMSLAAILSAAHGGETSHEANVLRVRLPRELQRGEKGGT